MQIIFQIIDFFLHIDKYLAFVIDKMGVWTYLILFLVIFLETGIVITPFLPGDSLLFAVGALAATGSLNIFGLVILLCLAAIIGDSVNYQIGFFLGKKAFSKKNSRFFKKEYMERTQAFYEKYGGMSIIISRFVPIVRTFAPFLAGVGKMNYFYFLLYNIIGGIFWVVLCTMAGFFFGNLPFVQKNFSLVIVAIVFISILPPLIEYLKHKKARQAK